MAAAHHCALRHLRLPTPHALLTARLLPVQGMTGGTIGGMVVADQILGAAVPNAGAFPLPMSVAHCCRELGYSSASCMHFQPSLLKSRCHTAVTQQEFHLTSGMS